MVSCTGRANCEFRVLGPVEVRIDDAVVKIGGPRPRALLALLLTRRDRVVSVPQIVDALWGEQPPATATGRVQTVVSELRQLLRSAGLGLHVIHTRPGGYLMSSEAGCLDLDAFTTATVAGRTAAAGGDHGRAAAHFREALAAWTGKPLEGVAAPFAVSESARLEERRIDVVEAWAAAELSASPSPAPALLDDLAAEVAEHPERECLVISLMTALHRVGRTSEALTVYRSARRWLRDHLGLEPSLRLRRAEAAILHDKSPGSVPEPALDPPRMPKPAQLPAAPGFVGRAEELARLDALLPSAERVSSPGTVITVTGPPGAGKTSLAVHWAHSVAAGYPDGALFVNLRGYDRARPVEPGEALGGFLRALGTAASAVPADVDEAAALYRSLLAGKRMIVVLDNAHTVDQVRPLFPGAAACLTVVTSRSRLAGLVARDRAASVNLDMMTTADAFRLVTDMLGPDRVDAEPTAAGQLVERCGHLPLALCVAAANLLEDPDRTIAEYVSELETTTRLNALAVDGDDHSAVAVALGLSRNALSADARTVFDCLGVLSLTDFSSQAITALAGGNAEQSIKELVDAHLLQRAAAGRYTLHDLVADYAAQCARTVLPSRRRQEALAALLDWYRRMSTAGAARLYPLSPEARSMPSDETGLAGYDQALAWYDAERPNLVAAIYAAVDHHRDADAVALALSLLSYYDLRKHWDDWIATYRRALTSARRVADRAAEALLLNYIAVAVEQTGKGEEALAGHLESLRLIKETEDKNSQGLILNSLGCTYANLGQHEAAIEALTAALAIHDELGGLDGQSLALNNLGELYVQLGRHDEAFAYLEKGLAAAERLDNRYNMRYLLCALGSVCGATGKMADAVDYFESSLTVAHELQDGFGTAESLNFYGLALHQAGRVDEAHVRWLEAIGILEAIDPRYAARLSSRIAECCPTP